MTQVDCPPHFGVDIGTTSIVGVAVESAGDQVIAETRRPNDSKRPGRQWERLQDVSTIMATVESILGELTREHGRPASIGLTGQMHGIVYLDRKGQALGHLVSWEDARGDLESAQGPTYTAKLQDLTGYSLATGYGVVTHYVNLQMGEVPSGASSFCTIADYVAMRLAQRPTPRMGLTMTASLGCFNLDQGDLDREALQAVGIDDAILPEIADDQSLVGHTADGVPVAVAIGDNQASFLGAVESPADTLLINIGTGSQISQLTHDPRAAPGIEVRPLPGGTWLRAGCALCGGKAYAALHGFFADVLRAFGGDVPDDLYARMHALAEPPADHRLKVSTTFCGTRQAPDRRGSIADLSLNNLTPEHLVEGVLRGMANELLQQYQRFPEDERANVRQLIGSGDAIARNPRLARILAETFAAPLKLTPHREPAARGAARHAAGLSKG